ncbi:bifunctional diaminohydroxyphosphoribosylaminopyrimidine deaminase/5-amino-6-(5-phosphoribosylamino)uracil reductase RibD [Parvularcula sp. LCG005]|uniref:bifunctional diaminohydroxyphosphoribosylaminopyrimidine deaminase/5-amino-6-(5-phosphoribosylamino)uracil reductase RibD n=1 Tax=Parvularcula sp. LCG005 TaxID=3078805 RepID=UPI002942822E|nr:bifunctional diaminohydroxyphosphoribosylaminopyrimidine deaminase/5-amino-6-(5-phosphoribosylamino)uracil reductase RibD [Parvularcula sp. LCG005]WOI52817.1 bifunctional diaminohydroxyphosphoribosylaminopyrimidine deaminase/5-amino-6-(5-phosphoribosylamino)uracil reductase RibD [Parvularcula sp. LCG005]
MTGDTAYLEQAIALARQAAGRTAPNPMVGCLIVANGQVVGRGWHRGPGTPHAEAAALADAGDSARGATAYVTLEPCNHYGNTPPCAGALLDAGIGRVVYGAADTNPLAAGGADRLREAGVDVHYADDKAAHDLVRPWINRVLNGRPYVYAKLAMSLDGRTATPSGQSKWITGKEARAAGHDLRQQTDGIIVGIGTVLADDPSLDPRPDGVVPAPSVKIVLDTHLRTPPTAKLLSSPGSVMIVSGPHPDADRRAALEQAGAEICPLSLRNGRPDLAPLLDQLGQRGLNAVMIEGGGTVLGSAFDDGLVDEVWAFIAPVILGGGRSAINGVGADQLSDALRLRDVSTCTLGPDILVRGRV